MLTKDAFLTCSEQKKLNNHREGWTPCIYSWGLFVSVSSFQRRGKSKHKIWERRLKDPTYIGAGDNSDLQKPDLWFPLIIAKRKNQTNFIWLSQKASVSVAATDSWSRGQSFLTGSATLRLGRGGFRTVNSISFQFATVFLSVCHLYFAHFIKGM